MESLKRLIYPGVLLFAFALLATFKIVLNFDFKIISSLALTVTILVVAALEYLIPFRKDWRISKGDILSDFMYTMILFPLVVSICQYLVQSAPASLTMWNLSSFPIWIQCLLCLLTAEFLFYWLHRIFHTQALLWKVHYKHHSVQRVYWMNSGAFNPIDLFLNFFIYCLPFAFLKTNPMTFEYVLYFSAVTGLMEHANINFKAGALNYIFNTAELHRWHHSLDFKESRTNFGKALSIFDLLFSTFKYSSTDQVRKVGVE
ncbi:MAG: sterol desaturase family protein [Bdellovibrionota bacterium]